MSKFKKGDKEKIEDVLKDYHVDVLGSTVLINNKHFNFSYTDANYLIKDEFKGQYRYFGGLQCGHDEDSQEYRILEKRLCEIAEKLLNKENPTQKPTPPASQSIQEN